MSAIAEWELSNIITLREEVAKAKKNLKDFEKALSAQEDSVISRLKENTEIEGNILARIDLEKGRCSPKWKEAFVALAESQSLNSEAEVKRVQDSTTVPTKEILVLTPKTSC
jgi:hypothetical protein